MLLYEDLDFSVGSDGDDDEVGDDLAGDEVEVGGDGAGLAGWPDDEVAGGGWV